MLAIIDGDIPPFLVGYHCIKNNEQAAYYVHLSSFMDNIFAASECDEYVIFLSGKGNFRASVSKDYKAQRDYDQEIYKVARKGRNYLYENYNSYIVNGAEADDGVAICKYNNPDSVILSNDKDLLQIPGKHFNYRKMEAINVAEREAEYNFWSQMLIGDVADNISGIKGVGKVKAKKLLEESEDLEKTVKNVYLNTYGNLVNFHKNFRMLRMVSQIPFNFELKPIQ